MVAIRSKKRAMDVTVASVRRPSISPSRAAARSIPRLGTAATGSVLWTLRLLRTVRVRVALLRFTFLDLDTEPAERLLTKGFGRSALVERLSDASFLVLLIGSGAPEGADSPGVIKALRAALDGPAAPACLPRFEVTVLQGHASEIGDPEDFLMQLLTSTTSQAGCDVSVDAA
jgi:hypothetical protein